MTTQKPKVVFLDTESTGLIVLAQTNIWYQAQTGGYACFQDRAEGFYVPLSYEVVDHYVALHAYFAEHSPEMRGEGIDDAAANFINAELSRSPDMLALPWIESTSVSRERHGSMCSLQSQPPHCFSRDFKAESRRFLCGLIVTNQTVGQPAVGLCIDGTCPVHGHQLRSWTTSSRQRRSRSPLGRGRGALWRRVWPLGPRTRVRCEAAEHDP
jgi:hypothetical protein